MWTIYKKQRKDPKKILPTQNKFAGSGIKNESISNKELAEELHKPIIRKFKKRKVHSPFIDSIWGADLSDMQLISKLNEGFIANMHALFL